MSEHDYPYCYFPVDAPNTGYRFDTGKLLPWQTLEELRHENKGLYWARYQALLNRYSFMLALVIWFTFMGMAKSDFQSFSWSEAGFYSFMTLIVTGFSMIACYLTVVFTVFLFEVSGDIKNWFTGRDIC